MLMYCPKCSCGYEIDEELIRDKSKKVRCSHCNEIFDVGSLVEKSVDNMVYGNELENISEENAFDALAALMRDADALQTSEIFANREFEVNKLEIIDEQETQPYENQTSLQTEVDENIVQNITDIPDLVKEGDLESEEKQINENEQQEEKEDDIIDIESIYERLSEHTVHLIEREKTLPLYEKIWLKIKDVLGFHFKIKWKYIVLAFCVFVSLSLYNNRYDVVRKIPFMNSVYKILGIKAKIAGEGLEFQNITWDYIVDEGIRKMEVKGFINNITADTIDIPIVHVEILDKKTSLLQSFNKKLKDDKIFSSGRIPLQIVVENPAPTAKYIYLTFIDKE